MSPSCSQSPLPVLRSTRYFAAWSTHCQRTVTVLAPVVREVISGVSSHIEKFNVWVP